MRNGARTSRVIACARAPERIGIDGRRRAQFSAIDVG
jgi:hypothetical protein